jgi:hypothetical protein
MSFNKRFFDWEKIKNFAEPPRDFKSFDDWILNPDAYIMRDKESSDFLKAYSPLKEDLRNLMFEAFREEDDFIVHLIKFMRVSSNKQNDDAHIEPIKKYTSLFAEKWGIRYEKYKNLIQ